MSEKLANLLFGALAAPEDLERAYPERNLPEGAKVTRLGPSPTGFIHLGNLFGAIIDERLARQSGGVFFLRIEDTDEKRKVDGAAQMVIDTLRYFNIRFDEGATGDSDIGDYGPYTQSERKEIYHVFARELVKRGMAYPCFMSEEELSKMREAQKEKGENPGCYGEWALHRGLEFSAVSRRIEGGESYVLRFKSDGSAENKGEIIDGIRGALSFQENYQDFVLLKSNGIPTYHFAHVVDDHLMRTTHVVRGEEWLASLPMHVQLFDAFGWKAPVYCHTAQLMKLDGEARRKLSKRHDPELSLEYYKAKGYLPLSVWEYLMTVLNSNFEGWRLSNPDSPIDEFGFSLEKMSTSGALFDTAKLNDISRDIISRLDAGEVYSHIAAWAAEYDPKFFSVFTKDPSLSTAALAIGRGGAKPRKDFANWEEAREFLAFYFDEFFAVESGFPENVDESERAIILRGFLGTYSPADDRDVWFEKVRALAAGLGYAAQMKEYKKDPGSFKGHIGDVSGVIRVSVTGRQNSPDLWEVFRVLGEGRVRERIGRFI